MENIKPETTEEVLFIRGLPYYAPQHAKNIAFLLDNGSSKKDILKMLSKDADVRMKNMLDCFIDFYLAKPERAKELFMPYSVTDYSMSRL